MFNTKNPRQPMEKEGLGEWAHWMGTVMQIEDINSAANGGGNNEHATEEEEAKQRDGIGSGR
jgi:hypothetical protein